MSTNFLKTLFIFFLGYLICSSSFAQGDNQMDTLLLKSGETLIGQVENLYDIMTADGGIARREFTIDTAWGRRIYLPLSEVKYVKAFNGTFEQVELNTGVHHLLELVADGNAKLYLWRKIPNAPGGAMINSFNDNKSFKPTLGNITDNEMETWMLFTKDTWYTLSAAMLKRKFNDLFSDCPILLSKAKNKDFNYRAILKITKEYNTCRQ